MVIGHYQSKNTACRLRSKFGKVRQRLELQWKLNGQFRKQTALLTAGFTKPRLLILLGGHSRKRPRTLEGLTI